MVVSLKDCYAGNSRTVYPGFDSGLGRVLGYAEGYVKVMVVLGFDLGW